MSSIGEGRWRERIERGIVALLSYVEDHTDGFVILVHGQVPGGEQTYSTLLSTFTAQVADLLGRRLATAASTRSWHSCTPRRSWARCR